MDYIAKACSISSTRETSPTSLRPGLWLIAICAIFACGTADASVRVACFGGGSPLSGQVVPGSTVTLQVTAIGQGANIHAQVAYGETDLTKAKFQWFREQNPLAGATSATLVLPHVTAADAGNYAVRVTSVAPATDWGMIAINVAPAPVAQFVDRSFTAPDTSTGDWSYLKVTQLGHIEAVLADRSVIISGPSAGDFTGFKVFDSDGSYINGWVQDRIHYPTINRFWPDGTIVTFTTVDPGKVPTASVFNMKGPVYPLPNGFDYGKVTAALVDGSDLLIAQDDRLVRLSANRSLDATFTAALPASTTSIVALKGDRAGHYLVTVLDAANQATLVRLNRDGQADPTFRPFVIPIYSGKPWVGAYEGWIGPFPQDDGGILWTIYSPGSDTSQTARLNVDGTRDNSFAGRLPYAGGAMSASGRAYLVSDGHVRSYLARGDLEVDSTFYPDVPNDTLYSVQLDPVGDIVAVGRFTEWSGHKTVNIARLLPTSAPAPFLPAVWLETRLENDPSWLYVRPGSQVTIAPNILGEGPFSYEWVAIDGGALPSDSHSRTLSFGSFSSANFGRYQLRLSTPAGVALSDIIDLSRTSLPPVALTNLSGRATVGSGENTLFAGFVQESVHSNSRNFLLRGSGPALAPFGVSPTATDPMLTLFDRAGAVIDQNDNWSSELATYFLAVGAFPFTTGSVDAAIVGIWSGLHTVQLSDRSPHDGVGMVEVYDMYPADFYPGRLVNLSLRAHVGTDAQVAIAGFVIVDATGFGRSLRVLVRGIGPALAPLGVEHPLANPQLTLFNSAGAVLNKNDDWNQNPDPGAIRAAMKQVGAFDLPPASADAALLVDLPPGAYTAHVYGVGGTVGVALLEIYLVQ